MSQNIIKFLNKKENNFNDIYEMNKLTSQNNEINYEYSTDENNNILSNNNQENDNIIEENQLTTENQLNIDTDLKNEEDNENENQTNNEQKSEKDEESQETDEELPLITLNFISVCQCCKNKFDKKNHLPYLLKCGHFFCLNCIKQYFTDKTGIVCPSDGLVAQSVKELKLLKYLIFNQNSKKIKKMPKNKRKNQKINNNNETSEYHQYMKRNLKNYNLDNNNNNIKNSMNNCHIHKNQKLTHIICDTNEIICVHCAFEMLKLNPSLQIKELKEKYNDLSDFIDNIMNSSQKNIDLIQNTIELIKKNKENELKKVKLYYNNLIKYLENEKKSKMQKIESISKDNLNNLEQKLLIFNEIIEQSEEFQNNLDKQDGHINQNYSSVINNYNNILKLNQSNNADHSNNKLKYIKFINRHIQQVKDYINKIANVNVVNRIIKYHKKINSKENNENINQYNDYLSKTNEASSMRYIKRIVKKHSNNKKNISSDNLYDKRSQNDSSEYYSNFNNSVKGKTSLYLNKNNQYDNNTFELNKKKNISRVIKTPAADSQFQKKFINKKLNYDNRSLLENYFELKNKDNLNNNNYNEENDNYFLNNTGSIKSHNTNKSAVNNLNILNNFYNLDYSRKTPSNNSIKTKKYVNAEQIKLYKESLNKLIPKQLKQVNFD